MALPLSSHGQRDEERDIIPAKPNKRGKELPVSFGQASHA